MQIMIKRENPKTEIINPWEINR